MINLLLKIYVYESPCLLASKLVAVFNEQGLKFQIKRGYLKVSRSQNCRVVTSPKNWTNKFVFLYQWLGKTCNLNFDFKFQVFLSCQDRNTNSSVCFLGEVTARQSCFEIYWPLDRPAFRMSYCAKSLYAASAVVLTEKGWLGLGQVSAAIMLKPQFVNPW